MRVRTNKYPFTKIIAPTLIVLLFVAFGAGILTSNNLGSSASNPSASASTEHPYDLNNDNKVDDSDLSTLKSKWGTTDSSTDINKDGKIDIFDASLLISKWGAIGTSTSCTYPAQILNLTNWKQTLPIGSSGSPTEIKQPALATYVHDTYFKPNSSCTGVRFRAPTNGVTTSGSSYPRSELREMTNNGSSNASWSTTSGVHTMFIDQAITAVPTGKKHIVTGQIHDANDDVIVIRLEYPKLFIDHNGNDGPVLTTNYVLGTRFTIKMVASNGSVKVYYNGTLADTYPISVVGNYFKAGAYTQSNCTTETQKGATCSDNNFGEVEIFNVWTTHE